MEKSPSNREFLIHITNTTTPTYIIMSISLTTIDAARAMFQEGFERQAQQIQSRFRNFADVKTGLTGKSHVFKKIRKMEMNDVTGRFQPTVGDEANWDYRYLF